ncbi:MAG: hypothetical protein WCI75_17260, partial [candidate division NC10 bacterium]
VEAVRNRTSAAILWGHRSRVPSGVRPFLHWPSGRRWAWGLGAAAAGVTVLGAAALFMVSRSRPSLGPVAVRAPTVRLAQAPAQVLATGSVAGEPRAGKMTRKRPAEPDPFADIAAMSASQAATHIRELYFAQSHSPQGLTPGLAARIEYVLEHRSLSDRDRMSMFECLMPARAAKRQVPRILISG